MGTLTIVAISGSNYLKFLCAIKLASRSGLIQVIKHIELIKGSSFLLLSKRSIILIVKVHNAKQQCSILLYPTYF
jgi:hypothetical protein